MDMLPADNSTPDPLDLRHFTKVTEAEHAEILEAARAMGIQSGEPFGLLLTAMLGAQRRSAGASMATVAELSRIISNARLATEGDILRQRQIQKETAELHVDLRRAVTDAVGGAAEERRSVRDNLIKEVLPSVTKALAKPLVIRERRHNYLTLVSGALVVITATSVVFLVGFSLALWTDWRGSKRLDDLQMALARCETSTSVSDVHGNLYCSLASLLPKDADPVRATEGHTHPR